jgi:hypothetical protein
MRHSELGYYLFSLLEMQDGRHPICRAPRQSVVDGLALKFVHRGRGSEAPTVIQAVHIDDRAQAFVYLGDSGDEDAAATADEEIAGAGAESVPLN